MAIVKFKNGVAIAYGMLMKDVECKTVGSKNSNLTKFSIKSDAIPTNDGEFQTVWTNCECWNSVADFASSLKKFDVVMCMGKLKYNECNGKTYENLICDFIMPMPSSIPISIPANNTSPDIMADYEEMANSIEEPF